MPNSDWNQRIRNEVAAITSDAEAEAVAGCQADALKGLLNTIVRQISEADKRHTDVLGQLQERLSGLGEDARVDARAGARRLSNGFGTDRSGNGGACGPLEGNERRPGQRLDICQCRSERNEW